MCAKGYRGPLCGSCVDDYFLASTGFCVECSGSATRFWVVCGVMVVLLFGAAAAYVLIPKRPPGRATRALGRLQDGLLRRFNRSASKLRIAIAAQQMFTQLGVVFTIAYPPFYKSYLRWLNIINLDLIEMMPLSCMLEYNFYTSLVTHTLVPVVFILGLIGAQRLFLHYYSEPRGPRSLKIGIEYGARCITAAFYIVRRRDLEPSTCPPCTSKY